MQNNSNAVLAYQNATMVSKKKIHHCQMFSIYFCILFLIVYLTPLYQPSSCLEGYWLPYSMDY